MIDHAKLRAAAEACLAEEDDGGWNWPTHNEVDRFITRCPPSVILALCDAADERDALRARLAEAEAVCADFLDAIDNEDEGDDIADMVAYGDAVAGIRAFLAQGRNGDD